MPDRPHLSRGTAPVQAIVLGLLAMLLVAAAPATAFAASVGPEPFDRITIADVPDTGGEDCVDDPNAQPGVGLRRCPTAFDIGSLLPFVAGGVALLVALAVGWYLVMRRRLSRPFLPDEAVGAPGGAGGVGGAGSAGSAGSAGGSGEWWTCSNCGSSNMIGSARCYKCGSWQR